MRAYRQLRPIVQLVLTSSVAAVAAAPASPQTVRLNGPLPQQPGARDVFDVALSPDGARVVFRGDVDQDQVFELFSVPADGSAAPVRLNTQLPPGGNVGGAAINVFGAGGWNDFLFGAGGRVVYVADQTFNNVDELFSVPADGSAPPVKLDGSLAGTVATFETSDDGTIVVYQTQSPFGLYRVPTDGSALALALTPNHAPFRFWLSADGTLAAFATYESSLARLYVVPTDGSAAPILLHTPPYQPFASTSFEDVRFSDDDAHVVFAVVDDFDGEIEVELYSEPTDASAAATRLNLLTLDGYLFAYAFDGDDHVAYAEPAGVVYSVALDGSGRQPLSPTGWTANRQLFTFDDTTVVFPATAPGQSGVFAAPIAGGAALQLAGPSFGVIVLEILGDSVVAARVVSGVPGLYAMPLQGGSSPVLLTTLPSTPIVSRYAESYLTLRPGTNELVFRYDLGTANETELFLVPLDGSAAPRKLNAELPDGGDVTWSANTADGVRTVYLADQNGDETFELFGAELDTSAPPTQFNEPLPGGPVAGDVLSFLSPPDAKRVVYRADQEIDEFFDLYSVRLGGAPVRLTSLPTNVDVQSGFVLTPAGDRAVFQAATGVLTLYATPTSGAAPAVVLDTSAEFSGPFLFAPSGAHVWYRKRTGNGFGLFRAPLDGAGSPIMLADPAGASSVVEAQLTPDGLDALYRADTDLAGRFQLYRVPSDGSASGVALSGVPVAGGDVDAFQISADGSRVVYRADELVDQVVELFGVPRDGSTPPVKLNGTLVAGGDVAEFALTPDSTRVVYRADQDVDGHFELYAAPLDGSAPAVRLNAALVTGGAVSTGFTLGADGRVLYLADQDADQVVELYVVPSDGSAAPVKLNGALVSAGDVESAAFSPDRTRVVYLADQRVDGVSELFTVASSGGPAAAFDALPAFADVRSFQFAFDSSSVVYRADSTDDQSFALFRAPLDASTPPERISLALTPPSSVQGDWVVLADGDVLYRADGDVAGVFELYRFLDLDSAKARPSGSPTRSATVVH
jgi:Tol biopolymer transport system component